MRPGFECHAARFYRQFHRQCHFFGIVRGGYRGIHQNSLAAARSVM
jgi:hypothetical protein